jgi:hypothetical protein
VRPYYLALKSVFPLPLALVCSVWCLAGSGPAPIGRVLQATVANAMTDTAYEGTTVYDGETLKTDCDCDIRVQLGGPQMAMRPNSAAEVHGMPKGFAANLTGGTVIVSSLDGQKFKLVVDGVTVEPSKEAATTAQITRVSATEVMLTNTKGSLLVSMGTEVKTLEAGETHRLEVDGGDESGAARPKNGPVAPGKNHFTTYVVAAVAVGAGVAAWRAMVSPHKP